MTNHPHRSIYRTIVSASGRGAYDYLWHFAIQAKRDGCRYRIVRGGFAWRGNEGGYREDDPIYLSREQGRAAIRLYRQTQLDNARGWYGARPHEMVTERILSAING